MIWIILALTLGASITSIIHGVFMLFGSLTITGAAIPGIPSTMLAVLPIISAIFALIGGIIAFNRSKWGAVFLFIAMGLCVPARDTWLYGGLYFFAGLCCFFISSKKENDYSDFYDSYENTDDDSSYPTQEDGQDFYYGTTEYGTPEYGTQEDSTPESDGRGEYSAQSAEEGQYDARFLRGASGADVKPVLNNEPPKLRRRMSKSCPECGAVVSRDAFYCPTCGAKLFVMPEDEGTVVMPGSVIVREPLEQEETLQGVNDQLFDPAEDAGILPPEQETPDFRMPVAEGVPVTAREVINQMRQEEEQEMAAKKPRGTSAKEAAVSYKEFSRYTDSGKKPRRKGLGRKVFSIFMIAAGVGGALYFLLGLRKLKPDGLPPMHTDVVRVIDTQQKQKPAVQPQTTQTAESEIAEPTAVAVADNSLPNFTPDRNPRTGAIIGSNVNVRADHTTSSSRITRLSVGTRVEVLGSFNVPSGQYSGTWYNIATGNHEGWVYGKYLQLLGSGLPEGYSNALLQTFGSTKSEMVDSLGNPTRSTSSSVEWRGLTATVKGEDITRIRLTNSSRELQNGLKVGMAQKSVVQVMGYPSSVSGRTMNYNENGKTGLSVQLDGKSNVSSITVNEVR